MSNRFLLNVGAFIPVCYALELYRFGYAERHLVRFRASPSNIEPIVDVSRGELDVGRESTGKHSFITLITSFCYI